MSGLRVLRICSVYAAPDSALQGAGARFDPVGGMQNHASQLTGALDRLGVVQQVVTACRPTAPALEHVGRATTVHRLGYPIAHLRQGYWLPAARLLPQLAADADIVHAHLGEDLAVLPLAARAAARHGLPLVMTVHTSLRHTLRVASARSALLKVLGGALEVATRRKAAAVLALTPRLAAAVIAGGIPADRVHVLPSGVDPDLFTPAYDDPLPHLPRPRVLFVGRLHEQKGADVLVKAAALLRQPATVVMAGDGPLREEIARLADGRVALTGFLPHRSVVAALQHADVLVLPSRYEELGTALVEGMYAGLPIVASDTGGIPDVVRDGQDGLLVPPGNPSALAAALDRVLGDPSLARRLGDSGRERASAYTWPSLAARVLAVYEAVAGRRLETLEG